MQWFHETPGRAFLAYNATVSGDVQLGPATSIWFNAVVRGDVAPVVIRERVNVQDGAIVHCDTGYPNTIEDEVTIAHRAVVHGERVGRGSLIGIGAIVLGHTVIGERCIIGAGAVVTPGSRIPDRTLVAGVPGRIVRTVTEKELEYLEWLTHRYVDLVHKYQAGEFGERYTN
jgi:carbonic anhydrase/acetyltransferase-like protein (isoleucine patch superfamily)